MGRYFAGAAFLFAIGLFIFLRRQRRLATLRAQIAAAQHWPEANARIDSAAIDFAPEAIWVMLLKIVMRFHARATYTLAIKYRFEVAGRLYQGNRLALGGIAVTQKFARGLLERYPKDSVVRIRYNPENPRDNVVEPRELVQRAELKVIGPMVMGFGVIMFIIGLTKGH